MLLQGKKTSLDYLFKREDSRWKIDMTNNMKVVNQSLLAVAKDQGLKPEEFLFKVLESVTGKKVDANVWKPLQ